MQDWLYFAEKMSDNIVSDNSTHLLLEEEIYLEIEDRLL